MTSPDMDALLAQAQQMQAQLQEAQQKIVQSHVIGESGNGMVKITVQGSGKVTDVTISPEVVDKDDVETLQDLIVGAFDDANAKISELAKTYMGPLQGVLGGDGIGDMLGGRS